MYVGTYELISLSAFRIARFKQSKHTYFQMSIITVQLTGLAGFDLTKHENLLLIQHKQRSLIQTSKTGGNIIFAKVEQIEVHLK